MATKHLKNLSQFEEIAEKKLDQEVSDYFFKGSNYSLGLKRNTESLQRILLCPNVCVNVESRNTKTKLLGNEFSMPVGIGPCALHQFATEEGEAATAKGAEKANVLYVISQYSQRSLFDIRKAAPNAKLMFQMNILPEKFITKEYIKSIEKHGIEGFVFTVDHNSFAPDRPIITEESQKGIELPNMPPGFVNYAKSQDNIQKWTNDNFTWETIKRFINLTKLPVFIKGILTPKNAIEAIKIGASGIWISNHGGRNCCHFPATIDAFRQIAPIVKKFGIPLFADGGIRSGGDVVKFLAMGAKMVFIAKPVLSSLAVNGEDGLCDMLSLLRSDIETTLAMCGYNAIDEIDEKCLWSHKSNI